MTPPRIGYMYVLCIPLSAAIATPRGLEIAGLNYTGWLWLAIYAIGVLLIVIEKGIFRDERLIHFPLLPWGIFYAYNWISLIWCEKMGFRNIQDALQLSMPLVAGAAASLFVDKTSQLRTIRFVFGISIIPLAISLAIWMLDLMPSLDFHTGMRPLGLTVGLVGCVFLAEVPPRFLLAGLGWGCCLVIGFLSGGRTATLSAVVLPIFHPRLGGPIERVLIISLLIAVSTIIFYSDEFQKRFFYSGRGTISDVMSGELRGSGRFDAWPKIQEEANRRAWFGHGVGTAYEFVAIVWPGMNHVQNDYLRVYFESGMVGFTIFILVALWQTVNLFLCIQRSTGIVQRFFVAAWLGWLLFLMNATTGNPISYNLWFMNPLFVLMGAAYGVHAMQTMPTRPQVTINQKPPTAR